MSVINCRFCDLPIERSRVTPHYRRQHRAVDLSESQTVTEDVTIELERIITLILRTEDSPEVIVLEIPDTKDCMMCIEPHSTVLQPCGHDSSCRDCLARWWRESFHTPRCPICRTETTGLLVEGEEDNNSIPSWFTWRRRRLNRGQQRTRRRLPGFIHV